MKRKFVSVPDGTKGLMVEYAKRRMAERGEKRAERSAKRRKAKKKIRQGAELLPPDLPPAVALSVSTREASEEAAFQDHLAKLREQYGDDPEVAAALPSVSTELPTGDGPSVSGTFTRAEEKSTAWAYMRNGADEKMFNGDYIYVKKSLFYPDDAPMKLRVTITVL